MMHTPEMKKNKSGNELNAKDSNPIKEKYNIIWVSCDKWRLGYKSKLASLGNSI